MRIHFPLSSLDVPRWRVSAEKRIPINLLTLGISTKRRPAYWALIGTLLVYSFIAVIVYFWLVQPWIAGKIDIRIGADSDRYWESAKLMSEEGFSNLITLTSNFLGPALLAFILRNGFAVMGFNFLLFGIAMKVASSIKGVSIELFGFLMLLNAELFPALTTLNKEIFALLAGVLAAKYIYSTRRSKTLLLATLIVSMFARWEQAAILLLFLVFYYCRPFRGRPKLAIFTLIGILTVAYPLMFSVLGVDANTFNYILQGAHTIVRLDTIQAAYGFPIVIIPKAFMLIAGTLSSPWNYWNGEFLQFGLTDVQQSIFQPLGCLALLVVMAVAIRKGTLNLHRPIALLVYVTLIVSAVAPFIQPRYVYPVYVLLCLDLAKKTPPVSAETCT